MFMLFIHNIPILNGFGPTHCLQTFLLFNNNVLDLNTFGTNSCFFEVLKMFLSFFLAANLETEAVIEIIDTYCNRSWSVRTEDCSSCSICEDSEELHTSPSLQLFAVILDRLKQLRASSRASIQQRPGDRRPYVLTTGKHLNFGVTYPAWTLWRRYISIIWIEECSPSDSDVALKIR